MQDTRHTRYRLYTIHTIQDTRHTRFMLYTIHKIQDTRCTWYRLYTTYKIHDTRLLFMTCLPSLEKLTWGSQSPVFFLCFVKSRGVLAEKKRGPVYSYVGTYSCHSFNTINVLTLLIPAQGWKIIKYNPLHKTNIIFVHDLLCAGQWFRLKWLRAQDTLK